MRVEVFYIGNRTYQQGSINTVTITKGKTAYNTDDITIECRDTTTTKQIDGKEVDHIDARITFTNEAARILGRALLSASDAEMFMHRSTIPPIRYFR